MTVLDGSDSRLVIAFADDPQLEAFRERIAAFEAGPPDGQKTEPYAAFLDAIEDLRPLTAGDRISRGLLPVLQQVDRTDRLRLDLVLWHPGNRDIANEWLDEIAAAVTALEGTIVDSYINDEAGVLLARSYLEAGRVMELAEADLLAAIELLPTPLMTASELYGASEATLPEVHPPSETAPLVGLVDSGVASAHPLIAPAAAAVETLSGAIPDGEDRHGHGTMVAGLLLYGRLDRALQRGTPVRPICRVLSVSVLGPDAMFPEEDLWERDLAEAIEWCARQGARIVNLSIGDSRRPYRGPKQNPAAAIVDQLARQYDLAIFVAAGNHRPADYLPSVDEAALLSYPEHLVRDVEAGVLDPGGSALSLTVGGVTEAAAASGLGTTEVVSRRPFGRPGWPSPVTRIGPGVGGSVKPELVELAGTLGLEGSQIVTNDAELNVISTLLKGSRLLGHDNGSSFATPLATRVAAAVASRFPTFSGELLRALTLVSTEPTNAGDFIQADKQRDAETAVLRLMGYGRPSIARAIESTSHRALLIAESAIDINGVHIYEVPIPSSFLRRGGLRGIETALAFSPRTRLGRLDYMASKMEFYLTRGMTLDKVVDIFTRLEGEEEDIETPETETPTEDQSEDGSAEEAEDARRDEGDEPLTPSKLGRRIIRQRPSIQMRSRGANQVGRAMFKKRWPNSDLPCFLVVRSLNRWDDEGSTQSYALAVALWRSEGEAEVFAELEAQLKAVIEVPVEIELQ